MLTAVAARGHLAYDAVCFLSFFFPLKFRPGHGTRKNTLRGPEPSIGSPGSAL